MGTPVDLRTEQRLGLALGGGGALGAAHVGVLQVLRERGITPSIVAGTSAGAVIGAAYAARFDPYELESLVLRAEWGTFGAVSMIPGLGVLDTVGLRKTIDHVGGGDRNIEDLPIRYAAVATDVASHAAVVLDAGSVVDAMCASIAVPGIFRPKKHRGLLMVDGGMVQNLPLETAFGMGADHVIGVRLAPEWDGLPQVQTSAHVHELEIGNDVTLIHPLVGARSQWQGRDIPGLIALGREAAERALGTYPVVKPRPAEHRVADAADAATP